MDVYSGYVYDEFDLKTWQLQLKSFLSLLSAVISGLCYWRWFTNLSFIKTFLLTNLLSMFGLLSQIILATKSNQDIFHISSNWFILIDGTIVAFVRRLAMMPPVILASQNCPVGFEGSMFSLYTDIGHIGTLISSGLSAAMVRGLHISTTDWSFLWLMILLCATSNIIPFLFLPCLAWNRSENIIRDRLSETLLQTTSDLDADNNHNQMQCDNTEIGPKVEHI